MMAEARLALLAAGGTGGHVFPARSLAESLLARGIRVALVTDRRGSGFGEELDSKAYRISAGSPGGSALRKVIGFARLARGYLQSRRLLRSLAPSVVIGFGGYPSVPPMMAATRARLPTMLHEQNAVLGRANRLLAGRVDRIATAHETVSGLAEADRHKIVRTGNPVRAAIVRLRETPYPAPEPEGELRVLVLGGSQGARILSDVVPDAVIRLPETLRARLSIVQQCRGEDLGRVREAYAAYRVRVELAAFFEDLPERLGRCQLLIARAGASTVAELTAAGRPAILVPFAAATDDHQAANARTVVAQGGAWMMRETDFRPESLAARFELLLRQPSLLVRAAACARECGIPDAADRLADLAIGLMAEGAGGGGSGRGDRAAAGRAPLTLEPSS